MNKSLGIFMFVSIFALQHTAFAIEAAPHISDREIVESLTAIRGDIKRLDTRIDDLRSEMIGRFDGVNHRFEEVNHRFDTLQWMFGLFITIALAILGFVLRMQWQMHRRQTHMETVQETQRDELSFIKGIIEKLLPPRGVL